MADNAYTETNQEASLAGLVSGIVRDVQQLIRQEMALARGEVQQSLEKAWTAALSLGIAAVVGALSGIMFVLMVVHLLSWLIPGLPLWGSYAIVGGVLAVAAAVLVLVARERARAIVPRQTIQSVKENVQWIKNQT